MTEQFVPPMTRRGLLGSAAAAGLVLAGCGGNSSDPKSNLTNTTAVPPADQRKRGGTFRLGSSQINGTVSTDPQQASSAFLLARTMFSGLVERGHDYQLHNALAEEFAPEGTDFRTWTIRVRDGVEFHNGKTLDIDDVIYSIKRNLNPKTPGFTAGLMDSVDTKRMDKLDQRTVRLHLKFPNSQLRDGFGEIPSCILPVGFDPARPVGTGPFKQLSFAPNRRWVGTRNEHYWKAGLPYLDRLVLIGFADQNSRVNALVSGQVDGIDTVLPSQVAQVKGRGNLNVVISDVGSFEPVAMNSASGPFKDPRARMAFKLMVDRKQLLNAVYAGYGDVGNDTGTWSQFDRVYPAELPQREQDLEKARSLAKASGLEGKTVPIRLGETVPGIFAAGEILAEQAKQIGLKIELKKFTDLAQFYGSDEYYTTPLKIDYDYTQTLYDNLSYCWLPGRTYNSTGYDNPNVNGLYKDALKTDGEKYRQTIAEIANIVHEDGPWCVWGRRNIPDAITKKFTGLVPDAAGTGYNGCYLEEISLA